MSDQEVTHVHLDDLPQDAEEVTDADARQVQGGVAFNRPGGVRSKKLAPNTQITLPQTSAQPLSPTSDPIETTIRAAGSD